jgi:hypothetical protein
MAGHPTPVAARTVSTGDPPAWPLTTPAAADVTASRPITNFLIMVYLLGTRSTGCDQ